MSETDITKVDSSKIDYAIESVKSLEDKLFILQVRELELRRKVAIKTNQIECSHIAGGLGDSRDIYGRTSIVWHDLDPGKSRIIGICQLCNRKFFPEDIDYYYWRSLTAFNRISRAAPSGPGIPLEEGETVPENQFIPIEKTYYSGYQAGSEEWMLRNSDLDKLSDFEISKLMEYVRDKRRKEKEENNAINS